MINTKIDYLINDIKNTIKNEKLYISFSGGLDSTVVAILAKNALGKDKVELVNAIFGPYSYSKSIYAVLKLSKKLDLKINFVYEWKKQEKLFAHGPNCNQCTKNIKIESVKKFIGNNIMASGANQSDSWGKTGLKYFNGIYCPLIGQTKKDIREILNFYNIEIPKIGENSNREGCKFKHSMKMCINPRFHAASTVLANEVIIDVLDKYNFKREIANVKVIGPLSKNIGLINIKPLPNKKILDEIVYHVNRMNFFDSLEIVDCPIELTVTANPGIYNNSESKKWIQKGRIAPEFAFPISIKWIKSLNNKLWTFSIVDYEKKIQ